MLVAYFDEVKHHPPAQTCYWLGCLVVTPESLWQLEGQVAELAKDAFGSGTLSRDTEFHAADIFHQKHNCREWNLAKRLDVLKRLISILGSRDDVGRIYVRLHPDRMVATDVEDKAFMFLVERVEGLLRARKSPGLLIGDRESEQISAVFAETLSRYRAGGTPYEFGTELTHLIDTVHFTASHHSRMLQLADLYVWVQQLCYVGDLGKWPRRQVIEHARSMPHLLVPNRYKVWPTEQSWIKIST